MEGVLEPRHSPFNPEFSDVACRPIAMSRNPEAPGTAWRQLPEPLLRRRAEWYRGYLMLDG